MSASDTIMEAFGIHPMSLDNIIGCFNIYLDCADVTNALASCKPQDLGDAIVILLFKRAINNAIIDMDEDSKEFYRAHFSIDLDEWRLLYWPDGYTEDKRDDDEGFSYVDNDVDLDAAIEHLSRMMTARNKNP